MTKKRKTFSMKAKMDALKVDFVCPFCKGMVTAMVTAASQAFEEHSPDVVAPALFHSLPSCEEFIEKEPTDFLHAARMRMSV